MLVYRLEDKEGYGPFTHRTRWPKNLLNEDRALHNRYGCTVSEVRASFFPNRGDWRFACRNITQLREYWGNVIEKWESEGWVVGVYRVRKSYIKFGDEDIELAFNINEAVRI